MTHRRSVVLFCNCIGLAVLQLLLLVWMWRSTVVPIKTRPAVSSVILPPDVATWDHGRHYRIHRFVFVGSDWKKDEDFALGTRHHVCLATQSSLDRLHWLARLGERWEGPLSIAVFGPDVEFGLSLSFLTFLRRCIPSLRREMTAHLVYPADRPPKRPHLIDDLLDQMPCDSYRTVLDNLLSVRHPSVAVWRNTLPYPQNLLRNIAKLACPTSHSLVVDIDMLPPPKLSRKLDEFLGRPQQQQCHLCAYVLPVYEVRTSDVDAIPDDKTHLLEMQQKGLARRFHVTVYVLNQLSSNLSLWEAIPEAGYLDVSYSVSHFIFKYEPIYVAKKDVPLFDERFVGFGMTRNTQTLEMYVSGWRFLVLNDAFLIHVGYQSRRLRPPWRLRQHLENNKRFPGFAEELAARYGPKGIQVLTPLGVFNTNKQSVNSLGIS